MGLKPYKFSCIFIKYTVKTKQKPSACKHQTSESIWIASLYFEAYYTLGINLSKREKYNEAEQAYYRAIEARPDYGLAYYNLAVLLKEREKSKNVPIVDIPVLICASAAGFSYVVLLLLDEGAEIDVVDNNGRTALIWACAKGRIEIVKLLLDKGANLHVADKDGRTALIWASANGHVETVKLLLKRGASIDFADINRDTAYSLASLEGHTEVVNQLSAKGTNAIVSSGQHNLSSERASSNERKMMLDGMREFDLDRTYIEQTLRYIYPYLVERHKELFEDKLARAKGKLKDALDEVASIPFPERKEIIKELLIDLEPLKGEIPPPLPDPDLSGNTYPLYVKRTDPFKHLKEVWGPWLVRYTPSLKHNYLDQKQLRERDPVLFKALSNRVSRTREQVRDFIPSYSSPLP